MTVYLWNLTAYAIQLAAVVSVALAALWLLRLRVPRMSLRFWQAVMIIALLLPFAQPQRGGDLLRLIVQSGPMVSATQAGVSLTPEGVDIAAIAIAILVSGILLRLAWLGIGLLRLRGIVAQAVTAPSLARQWGPRPCNRRATRS